MRKATQYNLFTDLFLLTFTVTRSRILTTEIPHHLAGLRLDQALAVLFPDFSRARLQTWIKDGHALLDGIQVAPRQKLLGGERVELRAEADAAVECEAEAIPLTVVHADESIFVIDKPAGLVVHPAAGHPAGTLQNALLHLDPALAAIPRCGIVHRLDKDTSGLLVVARTLEAHKSLVDQLKDRSVNREYLALVQGMVTAGATVDEPIGRHPADRKRFAVRPDGRESVTHYRVEERFLHHTLLRVRLETGRTHQIRVHMAHLHHPLVGDPVYGGRARIPVAADPVLIDALRGFRRQALHAARLGLIHPEKGGEMAWESPLPPDFDALLRLLRSLG
ncbi:23S rRNA pseudouridine(1911/1915/1917) synthase RluD [Methylococcus capsulatus]|uniref:23S rRNA pseudouridine(1911/1915/1917) synthase RluD n=1 Tax=Methylococcus capsulatus TaxID=414 RepID=UPI001C52D03C|nr:23S rRNA pseudouridine(1911/1915/1917) synthase RluD [Methylococcus capsulatus]QXP88280.1 23S rRNA pseudouridine(1911/1915/1917) synthase RluD [Methylococcus capsulatus]QXP94712.1 23S rRNA pseudouridine(1911/1915/1917) synthase RluD [Methylococcus capsulatus]UQN13318.1 23S rRNA pseudouridine(1911/1915/1917) synthase RluD [Methylococcus capsulatus]